MTFIDKADNALAQIKANTSCGIANHLLSEVNPTASGNPLDSS